ncbi:MAG: class I SAM-dependent DNA methyltransferase [Chloroflexota bacterium]|nr:class I SAM-dependent DNA methyltransferase [Chloroflexota bacterium]
MQNFSEKVNFIWSIADLIRDSFKRAKYQDVILPFTVLRRIDSVLAPTRQDVLETLAELRDEVDDLHDLLCQKSGFAFYNTSRYDFDLLLADAPQLADNLRNYIAGFSDNMREVIERFDFDNTIKKLDEANLLYLVMERFKNIDLHPRSVSNAEMGLIFEELIRKFNEASNENPGEHFTPREVIRLMVELLMAQDAAELKRAGKAVHIYDPCCGTGGMLTIAKNRIDEMNRAATVRLYGQEVNPETFAVAKSDLYMLSSDGKDAENIAFGSTLSDDRHRKQRFDYILANPPYGKEWKNDRAAVEAEADRGSAGRFEAGTPRISDGQMLFLQHMISKMRTDDEGSRIAIVMNGSPLFTGDAGSGESEIRRWILENDWLDAIIALPEQLFYNTGISTYVWILTNRKAAAGKGLVQLIDATSFWTPLRKNLGDKRREISNEQIAEIVRLYRDRPESEYSKVFDRRDFGYRKVTVERPLQLNFQATPERIARLEDERSFQNLAKSKKRDPHIKAEEEAAGRREQARVKAILADLPTTLFKDRDDFLESLNAIAKRQGGKLSAPMRKAILSALSERDDGAAICRDRKGQPEADSSLRDYETVPLTEDVHDYFAREVAPHLPDAWINTEVRDHKDDEIGKVGYEINFNRYFYQYQPPRPLDEINADIRGLQREIVAMLREVIQ